MRTIENATEVARELRDNINGPDSDPATWPDHGVEVILALYEEVERLTRERDAIRAESADLRARLGDLYAAGVIDGTGRPGNPLIHASARSER